MKPDYFWIGWNHEEGHDQVWGIIKINGDSDWRGNYVSFWGRRGKKLQTKIYQDETEWSMERLFEKKEAKGYEQIDLTKLNKVYPEFEKDLEKMTFWAQFKV